jgi:CheY-like chemotaxis protein
MLMKRILVVDNERYIQEAIEMCLETIAGWEVMTAGSGSEGLLMAETEQPDAILLDFMMPDMDGLMTFQELQANPATQSIPVILLTGDLRSNDRQKYHDLGIKAVIIKPFNPMTLAEQISQLLEWETD